MKKLFIYLFLILFIFSAQSYADDINDFEMGGISIGNSLLEHMSKEDIIKNTQDVYHYIDEKRFKVSVFYPNSSSSNYEFIQVTFKINDDKYIIHGVEGVIGPIGSSECLLKQKEVKKDINNLFENYEKSGPDIIKHPVDSTGKSIVTQFSFELNGNVVLIECYDFSKQVSYQDSFKLSVYDQEFNKWLQKYQ